MEKFDARKSRTNNIRRHYEQNIVYFLAVTVAVVFFAVRKRKPTQKPPSPSPTKL